MARYEKKATAGAAKTVTVDFTIGTDEYKKVKALKNDYDATTVRAIIAEGIELARKAGVF